MTRFGTDANQKGSEIDKDDPAITFSEGVKEIVLVEDAPFT